VTAAAALLAALLAVADGGAPDAGLPVEAHAGEAHAADPAAHAADPAPAGGGKARARAEHAEALTRLRAGAIDEAAGLLAQATAHDPSSAVIATDYGFALGRLGERADAEKVLRAAIDKDPKRVYAYLNLAELWAGDPARWEKRDAAVAFLERGLDAVKDDRKDRFNLLLALAGFERAVGRTAAARARLAPLLAPDAAPLARPQRKRVLDLLDAVALDERAHALEDWPPPSIAPADAAKLAAVEREGASDPPAAIAALDPLLARAPAWARARLARARALEAAGRIDEAARDLEIAVNLAPSNAEAWRALGRLLAAHGGALELARADEALKQALTLEPAWTDLRDLRAGIARRRTTETAPTPAAAGTGPSDHARALYQEAEEWIDLGDPAGFGRDRLEEALADSPGFVAAAVSMFALTGTVPQPTIDALWNDGAGLWALAAGVRKLGKPAAKAPADKPSRDAPRDGAGDGRAVDAWIDRAVALDVQEARFARAASRAAAGDRAGALEDLVAYVAREPSPEHLAEAQALRAGLADGRARAETRPSPQLLARIRLLEDRPDAALRALGGSCTADLPPDRLLAIGLVHEYAERRAAARACYELGGDTTLVRLARLDARLPDAELRDADRRPLARADGRGVAAAAWALARLASLSGDDAGALARTERALALAAGSATDADVWLPDARTTAARLAQAHRAAGRAREDRRRRIAVATTLAAGLVLALAGRRRWRGRTVAAALRRRPALYPEVARAVGELRHDVLKHRAGVLGALGDGAAGATRADAAGATRADVAGATRADLAGATRADVARALLEPRPASTVVTGIYDRLAAAARGAGTELRPLAREPVFGALVADLGRAEALLARSARPGEATELGAIDARLRADHADALGDLLGLGPRTRLDAGALARWIAAAEAAARRAGASWSQTALALADLDVDFPVEENALEAIFANLLRNAQAAVAGAPEGEGRVLVRVDRERDVTGRQTVTLFVGDSAPATLTLEAIEARESGRGLAIVRDLVRAWRGHLVVRPEPAPLAKLVGACFPL
jgi:tetratricopeptide (TPR) repeat protein